MYTWNMATPPSKDVAAPSSPNGSCELLGEFGTFGWWLQGLLGILSFGSLLAKRRREFPKRPCKVFLFDCSKQASGAFFIHMLNLGSAGLMAAVYEQDVCVWYWINIMVDTTLGVYFQYLLLQAARRLFKKASCLGPLVFLGSLVLAALDPYPQAKLTVVMVATPLLMNSLQYWLTDNFIKKKDAPNREIPVYNVVQTTDDLTPTIHRRD